MTKHYVLSLDPTAEYDWDRCTLRDPITAERPDLSQIIAEVVGQKTGAYLVSVNIEVQVLEQAANAESKAVSSSNSVPHRRPEGLVA